MLSGTDKADRGRDLLFGVISLQMSFIDQAQFVEVMALLASHRHRSAEELFLERKYLTLKQAEGIRLLLDLHLEKNGPDVTNSLAAFEASPTVRDSLVLIGEKALADAPVVLGEVASAVRTEPDRYVLGRELGRGGLGRVVLALDRQLMSREVAMKLLLPAGAPEDRHRQASDAMSPARRRFLEEALVTAQLQHPNIVAVHELGTRPDGDPYYTMPVITGRTLKEEIRAPHARLARGEISPEAWGVERHKLISAFQGLCHGLSYAHDRGVIHRDIKPDNVMVGEHGETIVVDWGLAKVLRPAEDRAAGATQDSRSDRELERQIRSLREQWGIQTLDGTVSGTPSYMPPEQAAGYLQEVDHRSDIWSLGAVLFEILTGRPPFDGSFVIEILQKVMAGDVPDPREASTHAPVPQDLAAVCLRAMRKDKAERYQEVRELLSDLILSIEGSKERERNRLRCEEKLTAARHLVWQYHEISGLASTKHAALLETRAAVKTWEPIDTDGGRKRKLLALEHELEEAVSRADSAYNTVLLALAEALAFEPDHRDARRELGEFHYAHLQKAERERDLKEFEFHRAQVAFYNDGDFDERLRGDGTVAITSDPPGAEALLYDYEETTWFLRPAHERSLGMAPLAITPLPMGSYLLLLKKEGYRETRVPFLVRRQEHVRLDVKLYTDGEIGKDFVYVPAGKFLMGERDQTRDVQVEGFFIGRFPVTFAQYCEWLDWLDIHHPAEVGKRAPQDPVNGLLVRKGEDGRYVPFDASPRAGHGDVLDPRLPVFSVNFHNAVAYLAWRSEQDGRECRLPVEVEWEKAARGADGRNYPWGNRFDATLCKMNQSTQVASQPEPVGAYPTDESPYGVRDMAGGVADWIADWYDERKTWKVVKGGHWAWSGGQCRSANRYWNLPDLADTLTGFRMVVRP